MKAPLWVALLVLAAGCSEAPAGAQDPEDDSFDDVDVEVTEDTGAIRGVVVNEAITPVQGATAVFMEGGERRVATTDSNGRFSFSKVTPGTYFLTVSKLNHIESQTAVTVEAGVKEPPIVKVQITRLFSQDPHWELFQWEGFFNCAHRTAVSSTCVNDYTRVCNPNQVPVCCPGGCLPELASLLDNREYVTELAPAWQSIVIEAVWEPNLAGTSQQLGMTMSYWAREGASHSWGGSQSESPMHFRYDLVEGAEFPAEIPAEGIPDLFVFFASGGFPSVSIQQSWEVFHSTFFNGLPPDGWSFAKGDRNPF